ncbi:MAG: tetratricopeptide repeat protein [Bacteroidia bacterium]
MAKQTKGAKQPQFFELKNTFKYFPFINQKQPIIVLALIGLIFYSTTLYNEYALDDGIIIHQNDHVIKGIAGIKGILTKDAYESFYRRMNATDQLAGGRYRPLSVVSFAIEQEFIGAYPQNGLYPQNCFDLNKNGKNDPEEDLNEDGVWNEVDCQVKGAFLRHFNNMWTYVFGCILLYLVFRNYMFKDNQDMAFLSALIFLTHPLHTEAIANVKSRDEIFSLIFISLTFFYSFRYMQDKKLSTLFWAAFMFFLALLSKEYAFVLLGLIPVAFYVFLKVDFDLKALVPPIVAFLVVAILMFALKWNKKSFGIMPFIYMGVAGFAFGKTLKRKDMNTLMIWLFGSCLLYLGMRFNAVVLKPGVPDTEILNNPYLLANGEERFCSKAYVLLKYFTLCWMPHPLSSDYSYKSLLYRHFTDWDFILSVVLHIALVVVGVILVMKRHVLGFAIATYVAFLLMIGNVLMDIGATMGERLLFHSTIGFAIALAWFILNGFEKLSTVSFNARKLAMYSLLVVVVFLYGCKAWERNWDWKNDITLFIKDANTMPNSVLVLGNAGARWIDLCDTKFFNKGPGENPPLPFSTYKDKMLEFKVDEKEFQNGLTKDNIIIPVEGEFKNEQNLTPRQRSLYKGIAYLKHAVDLHPRYVNGYLNLGLAYYKLKRDREALYYWKHAEKLYPNNPYLKNYYIVFYQELLRRGYEKAQRGRSDSAAYELNKCVILDRYNPEGWYNLGGAYFNLGKYKRAKACWQEALKLKPDHAQAQQGMRSISPQMLGEAPAPPVAPTPIRKN